MASSTRRLLVTLLIPALFLAAQQLLLVPGLDHAKAFQHVPGAWVDRSLYSVLALGLAPVLSAFVIVECLALLVPAWRPLRRSTPAQRRSLQRAALALTFALALVSAWFLSTYFTAGQPHFLDLFEDSPTTRLLITASLVGGVALTLLLVSLLDRFGLGNGFSILLVTPLLPAALKLAGFVQLQAARDLLWLAVELLAVVVGTRFILLAHRRAATPGPGVIRHPTSGLTPIEMGGWVIAALNLTSHEAVWALSLPSFAILIVVASLILSRLYHPPARLAALWRRVEPTASLETLEAQLAPAFKLAVGRTLLFLLAIGLVFPRLMSTKQSPAPIDLLLVVVATAVVLDLLAEHRARRQHGELVAVWPLHQVALLDVALAALAQAGIPVHARAAHHRALLWFFGPYLPIDLMVPRARAVEARERLTALLVD